MATIRLLNPHTGATGEVDADKAQEAIGMGAKVVGSTEMYNPETGKVGMVGPDKVADALAAGALLTGSRAHKVATTGTLESSLRGLAQGPTLGFAEEIQSGIQAFPEALEGNDLGAFKESYQKHLGENREANKIAEEAHPVAYHGAEIGGSIASSLIPGLGLAKGAAGAGKLAVLGREAALGAGLGTVSGAGYSEAPTMGEVGEDALKSGTIGGVLGIGGNLIGGGLRAVGGSVLQGAKKMVDPFLQRAIALGAKGDLLNRLKPAGRKFAAALPVAEEAGWLAPAKEGVTSKSTIFDAVEAGRQETAAKMHEIFNAAPQSASFSGSELTELNDNILLPIFRHIEEKADVLDVPQIKKAAADILLKVENSGGTLSGLWDLKKDIGRWAADSYNQPLKRISGVDELRQKAADRLGSILEDETASIAKATGNDTLAQLNRQYSAAVSILEPLAKQNALEATQANIAGTGWRDWVAGHQLGATVGAALGGAVAGPAGAALGAGIGGVGTALGSAAIRSTGGRLMRARIGEALHMGRQQQALATGTIPRTTAGIKQWLNDKAGWIDQMAPGLRPEIEKMFTTSEGRTETELRAVMPVLQQYMAPSPYESELNGKVTSPQDRLAISGQLQKMGLKPSELALRLSMLNKDGTIPEEVYAPAQPEDAIDNYAARLQKLGY